MKPWTQVLMKDSLHMPYTNYTQAYKVSYIKLQLIWPIQFIQTPYFLGDELYNEVASEL
jgi:hypothetical protein